MQVAARSYLAAGVALVGASAIAISPVAPPLPDVKVPAISSSQVELSASANPLEAYLTLVSNTVTNVQATINAELENPAPVLRQIIENQIATAASLFEGLKGAGEGLINILDPANPYGMPAQLQLALSDLLEGDINGAVANAWSAFLTPVLNVGLPLLEPIINAVKQPVQNTLNVLNNPLIVVMPVLGAINVAYTTITVAGNVGQEIVDSLKDGDALGVVNALLSAPAVITDAFLNGNELGGGIFGPNLGLLSSLRQAREALAAAITPPEEESSAVAKATLDSAAKVVTLDVAPAETKDETTTSTGVAVTGGTEKASAPASGSDVTAPVAEVEASAADTSSPVATDVVKDSPVAVPGKTGTITKSDRTNPLKQVRDDIRSTVKDVSDGFKKAAEGLAGKNARGKGTKSTGESSSSTSKSGDSSSSGSGAGSSDAA